MALQSYATVADLPDWVDDIPDNADGLLRSATIRVAWACNRNPYTDTPSTTDAAVLKDATCAAVAAWLAVGIDPLAGGLDRQIVSASKLLTGSVNYEVSGQLAAQQQAAAQVGEDARQLLLAAGLLWQPLPLHGDDGAVSSWGLQNPWPYPAGGFEGAQSTDAWGDIASELRTIVIENPGG